MRINLKDLFSSIPDIIADLFYDGDFPVSALRGLRDALSGIISNPPEGMTSIGDGVIIGRGVVIEDGATILPPTVIMDGATIRQGAYIRGGVFVGKGAVVGHCTEVKNSILMDKAQAPHFNYVGDSILGAGAHLGAGAILSNLKSDKSSVTIRNGDEAYDTGLKKLGALVGDRAEIGCGAVLNPGSVIGKNSAVYPLVSWRGVLAENSIAKSGDIVIKKN